MLNIFFFFLFSPSSFLSPRHPQTQNQKHLQAMMEKKLYDMAKSMEDALDDELHKMNNMGTDELENIRRKRMEAMKGDQDKRKRWLAQGHGWALQVELRCKLNAVDPISLDARHARVVPALLRVGAVVLNAGANSL